MDSPDSPTPTSNDASATPAPTAATVASPESSPTATATPAPATPSPEAPAATPPPPADPQQGLNWLQGQLIQLIRKEDLEAALSSFLTVCDGRFAAKVAPTFSPPQPTKGRIVMFVFPKKANETATTIRPAVIVDDNCARRAIAANRKAELEAKTGKPKGDEVAEVDKLCRTCEGINLQVFLDGENDVVYGRTAWQPNVSFDTTKAPGTWHWPERS